MPRRYRPVAADGTALDAWLLVPPAAPEPIPLVLEVHGGPHVAYGHGFFFEFQMLAGAGLRVAYGNPRGRHSYGQAYADAITGDWGGIDADDVQRILDGALAAANTRSRARRPRGRVVWRVHDDVAVGSQRPFRRRRFDARCQRLRQ